MLDIGWQELLVVGALALIVVGPKDLPGLLRSCGQWVGKVRGMAREFQRSMNDAAREADVANFKELRDLKNDIGAMNVTSPTAMAKKVIGDGADGVLSTDSINESAPAKAAEAPAAVPSAEPANTAVADPAPAAKADPAPAAKAEVKAADT